jgi:FkbM family methyltransferase
MSGIAMSAERLLGRRNLARVARFLGDQARLDVPNGMGTNGELTVQAAAMRKAGPAPLVAIDVGANRGEWSRHLLDSCEASGTDLVLHAFEPSAYTFDLLGENLGGDASPVTLVNRALSDHEGGAVLYQVAPGAGSNSMHGTAGDKSGLTAESIEVTTLDRYCAEVGLDHVDLVKIDAEGHDLLVLQGAADLLEGRQIDVAQFEYNWRWIGARRYLKDAFDFLGPLDYRIGKVTPRGIEVYDGWHPELETFREANYLAFRPDVMGRLPTFTWWNEAAARIWRGVE